MVLGMSALCPTCGVAVVPGYVRCPKCHAGLSTGRIKRVTVDPGGTALPQRSFPISSVLVALGVAAAIILVFGLRGSSKKTEAASAPAPAPIAATPDPPRRTLVRAPVGVPAAAPLAAPVPDATAVIRELEDTLHQKRLWGRVAIIGPRIDVRSGSCADPAMRPVIDGKKTLLHGAGLTKLRCLEQSGAVVFERDL
jgi:hypothetical protein